MIRTVLCIAVMLGVWLNPVPAPAAETMSEADNMAEHLLLAIGGRSAWANVTNTIVYSDQYRQGDGTPVGAVSTLDYGQSRLRIDTTGPSLQQIRIIDSEGDRSWRLDRRAGPRRLRKIRWRGICAATRGTSIGRCSGLPSAIPRSGLRPVASGTLEVIEGSTRIAWYALDARGEPYAMGANDDNLGVICGPWELEKRGIRYPTVGVASRWQLAGDAEVAGRERQDQRKTVRAVARCRPMTRVFAVLLAAVAGCDPGSETAGIGATTSKSTSSRRRSPGRKTACSSSPGTMSGGLPGFAMTSSS